jgi:hypothetical protein
VPESAFYPQNTARRNDDCLYVVTHRQEPISDIRHDFVIVLTPEKNGICFADIHGAALDALIHCDTVVDEQ